MAAGVLSVRDRRPRILPLHPMFRRVTPEEWIHLTSILAFLLTFLVFLGAVVRAWRLRRDKIEHLSRLPLETDQPHSDTHRHE